MTILNTTELAQLEAMQAQARADAKQGIQSYYKIYATLADWLETRYGFSKMDSAVRWLRGATEANAGRGAMSALIRAYTDTQHQLRYGTSVSAPKMQEASNAIAESLLKDLLGLSRDWPKGKVPDIARIGEADASAVGRVIFGPLAGRDAQDTAYTKNAAWSGTLLFTLLRSDQTWRLSDTGPSDSIDTLNDWRDVLFAYQAYDVGFKAARSELGSQFSDLANFWFTYWGYQFDSSADSASSYELLKYATAKAVSKSAFELIDGVGVNKFLDMLMGAATGISLIGTTTDANFIGRAKAFFSAYGNTLQTLDAKLMPVDAPGIAALAKADVNARAALAANSAIMVKVPSTVASKFNLYDPVSGEGNITDSWIADRAKAHAAFMLYWKNGETDGVLSAGIFPVPQLLDEQIVIEGATPASSLQLLIDGVDLGLSPAPSLRYFGNDNANSRSGDALSDHMYGMGGDDTLDGKGANDYLEGGSGNDTLSGGDGDDELHGGADNDTLDGGADADTLIGGKGDDTLKGGDGTDVLWGDGAESDKGSNLYAGARYSGKDTLEGGEGEDKLYGGAGDDLLKGDAGNDTMYGGADNDQLFGGDDNDKLYGGDHNDTLHGGNNDDHLWGEAGNDTLYGDAGVDILDGGANADRLFGGSGNDQLSGGDGDDTLDGGADADQLLGGRGFDTYIADAKDTITDGDGRGAVNLDGRLLTGGSRKCFDPEDVYRGAKGETYRLVGSTLMVDGLVIKSFSNGDLGIQLVTDPDTPIGYIRKKTKCAEEIPSPIILDLDGNGVVGTVGQEEGVYFDHAADGFAERTGWVAPGDGLLVWDTNANGQIDSGRELFGSETLLPNGLRAANGFEALKALDANADGVVDASDPLFSRLQVWVDADSNGRNDEGELRSLRQAGVQSIAVGYSTGTKVDAAGNEHRQLGSYTTSDGQLRLATDIWFKTDTLNSRPVDWVAVPDDIARLPDMKGYGKVRDLHQAMAMDVSGELKALVVAFTQAGKPEERDALVASIIYRWTGVQDIAPDSRASNSGYGNAIGDARKLEALEELMGEEWVGVWCWGTRDPNPHGRAAPMLLSAWNDLKALVHSQLLSQTVQKPLFQSITYQWNDEAGAVIGDLTAVAQQLSTQITSNREAGLRALGDFLYSAKGMGLLKKLGMESFTSQLVLLGDDVAQTINAVLNGWVATVGPTAGDDLLRGAESNDVLAGESGNDRLFGHGGNDKLYGGIGNDLLDGGAGNDQLYGDIGSDTYRFGRGDSQDIAMESSWGFDETDRIEFKPGIHPDNVKLERVRTVSGWQVSDDLRLTLRDSGETLTVKNHFDQSNRYAVEQIAFEDGTLWDAETIKALSLVGSERDDELYGFDYRYDLISGGAGDDKLSGLSGDDTLVGGTGNDILKGGVGSDSYLFGLGDGRDIVDDGDVYGTDSVVLAAGITPADITVRWTPQGDMAVTLPDGSRITARGQASYWPTASGIEELQFADGTEWHREELAARALAATSGDDAIVGSYQDDTLDGGAGNDAFQNLGGYDIYRFGIGDGHDVIASSLGCVSFKPGIEQNDVDFARDGKDLIATLTASGDSVRFKDWLDNWPRIDRFDFDNGARLDVNDVMAKLNVTDETEILFGSPDDERLAGSDKDSTIYGRDGNDVITGGHGSDYLEGEAGDDFLDGGADRDYLYGGEGNNRYLVAAGMGLDEIIVEGLDVANDTVVFAAGIRPQDISVQLGEGSWDGQDGNVRGYQLVIGLGGNDAVLIKARGWRDLGRTAIQHFQFTDGTHWALADVIARADGGWYGLVPRGPGNDGTMVGSQADDDIYDYSGEAITVQARANDDRVRLAAGNDRVSAGLGNDNLDTGAGDDLLAGEAGNDTLSAGSGDDVIVFNYGDGDDTLSTTDGNDTLSFGVSIRPSMLSAVLDSRSRVLLRVDDGAGGSITLASTAQDSLSGDLERIQFIDASGNVRVFDLSAWLRANTSALQSATMASPVVFDGVGFELTGNVTPAGGLEAIAYAQSGDLFAEAYLATNTPSHGHDVLYGTPDADGLDAGAGNDIVLGLAGDDTLYGGDGNDRLHGGDGDDLLDGNAGDDVILGGKGSDQLSGGAGYDQLFGEWGGDTYQYQVGHGEVIIDDAHHLVNWGYGGGGEPIPTVVARGSDESGFDSAFGGGYGGVLVDDAPNILTFGPGIRPQDLRYSELNGDLLIELANQPGDRVILRGYEPNRATQTRSVDIIRFADGTELIAEFIEPTGQSKVGGDDDDMLNGTAFADTLIGGDGNDGLNGNGGADILVGGAGSDTYRLTKEPGRRPAETLIAETWRPQDLNRIELSGDIRADDLYLEFDGRDLLLRYTAEGDVIRFAGFDPRAEGMQAPVTEVSLEWQGITLPFSELIARGVRYGEHTQNVYHVNVGDGAIFIDDKVAPNAENLLRFGPGIEFVKLQTDLRFEADGKGGYLLLVSYGGPGDLLYLTGFNPDNVLGGGHAIEYFELADGSLWDYASLVSAGFLVEGDQQSNELVGTNLVDRLHGGVGNDVLHGGAGSDKLYGEQGNDVLHGDAGDDTYLFQKGDGIDTIIDSGESDFNFIRFGTGIRQEDIRYEWDDTTLVIHYSEGDAVRVANYHAVKGNPVILSLAFDDGTVSSLSKKMNRAPIANSSLDDIAAVEDQDFTVVLPANLFSDPDASDELKLVVQQVNGDVLPPWLSFDAKTLTLSGKPSNEVVGSLALKVEGKDHFGLSESISFNLSIQNTNDAPAVAIKLAAQSANEDTAFSYTLPAGSFSDPDAGDRLSYQASLIDGNPLPSWLRFDPQSGTFSGTPANGDVGLLQLRVTASDTAGATASQLFDLQVVNSNDAPVAAIKLAAQSVNEDSAFSYTLPIGSFSDPDAGDRLSYQASLIDGNPLPAWLRFDPQSGTFSGTPANVDVGLLQLRVTASDTAGATASQLFDLQVVNTNDAPVVAIKLAAQSANEDSAFSYTLPVGSFSDPDAGDHLSYQATLINGNPLPSWLRFDPQSGTFSGSPANVDVGLLQLRVTASDTAGATATQLFDLQVVNTNDAPVVGVPLANQSGRVGQQLTWSLLENAFIDADKGDVLRYEATLAKGAVLPGWMTFDAATGVFTAKPDVAGSYSVYVSAIDRAGSHAVQSFVLSVQGGDQAPVLGMDTAILKEDQKLWAWGNLLDNDKDPEGKRLQVANPGIRRGEYGYLTILSNGLYAYALDNEFSKVQALAVGETVTDRFVYTASDGSVSSSSELSVTVQGSNDMPELNRYLGNVQLAKGNAFSWRLPSDSFRDRDTTDKLIYSATLSDGKPLPSWLKFDAETQRFSGIAPVNARASLDIRVSVNDGHGSSSSVSDAFRLSFGSKTVISQGALVWQPPHPYGNYADDWCSSLHWPIQRSRAMGHVVSLVDQFFDGFSRQQKASHHSSVSDLLGWLPNHAIGVSVTYGRDDFNIQHHWAAMSYALQKLDVERQQTPGWLQKGQGASLTGWVTASGGLGLNNATDRLSLPNVSGSQLKIFSGIREGLGHLTWQ